MAGGLKELDERKGSTTQAAQEGKVSLCLLVTSGMKLEKLNEAGGCGEIK